MVDGILDQRPDLERLLNSTIEFGTVRYRLFSNCLSKMPQKWTEGENLLLCRSNVLTKNANFKIITQISIFLEGRYHLQNQEKNAKIAKTSMKNANFYDYTTLVQLLGLCFVVF
jgi:hypothetical protein